MEGEEGAPGAGSLGDATAAAVANKEGISVADRGEGKGSGTSSGTSSGSRLSIRIPRNVVGSSGGGGGDSGAGSAAISRASSSTGDNDDAKGKGSSDGGEAEEAGESEEEGPRRRKSRTPARGRQRKTDDSEESAYEESNSDESESTEEYSEDDGEETESTEAYESESEEEWDDRRKKYTKKQTRNYVPPMTIPFQYTMMPGAYAPIAPLPPNMASIPMFRALAMRPPAPPTTGGVKGGDGEEKTATAMTVPSAQTATSPSTLAAAGALPASASASTLASAPAPPATPADAAAAMAAAASLEGPSTQLKETLSTMLSSPEWRNALLQKLQMNRVISAEQASKMGLRPAAPMPVPPMTAGVRPMMMMPMMGGRPMMMPMGARPIMPQGMRPFVPIPYRPAAPKVSKGERKKKKRRRIAVDIPVDDDSTIASRRERRTPRKAVDYSKFFKDDAEEEGSSEEDEVASESGESDQQDRRRPGRADRAQAKRALPRRTRHIASEEEEEDGYLEDEDDEEGILGARRQTDETGVEKILSHRVVDGQNEFLVKFHNLSYAHVEWISEEEMNEESMGPSRVKRFLAKPLSMRHFSEKHIFNPEYTQIGRIVHGWEHPDEFDQSVRTWSYLVKWVGLPYCDATWEKRATVLELPEGEDKLKEYEARPTRHDREAALTKMPLGSRPERTDTASQTLTESPVYRNGNALREYQLEGVNWLVFCWMNRQPCIIADEMGLGKTVQSVAFLDLLYTQYSICGPFLVIAPLSTIPHWEREFEAWTALNCIVYHGNIPSRDVIAEYEFFHKDEHDRPVRGMCKFDVLITTYEMAMAGIEHLKDIPWRAAIFDEAHRLKNRDSKANLTLSDLDIEHKVLLSGTPLQNNIEELWSLLDFMHKGRFGTEEQFGAQFGNLKRSEDVLRLQEMLKPLMLRRLKEDVEKSIPVKEETVIEVELTAVQKRYYRAILERNFAFLTKGCRGTNAPNLINAMMELRKCCIHPYLIKGAEERILEECGARAAEDAMGCMVQASGKLVLVDKLLRKLREGGHKVLIFSQMTRCLDLLTDYLRWREYPFERIDGAIKGELRQAAIDRFCAPDSDSFVFLLCTRAGGVGINLTAADTVVIFDSDWNPQNDIQAQARCHRIGQTKSVKVYRLLTRNTYEREMFDKAGLKLGLDKAVLRKILPDEALEGASHNPQLSKKEVEVLLKKGAYGLLMENDEDAIRFCEEDIDQILARRTTVIRHGGEAVAPEGSIFSKASFAVTADDMDIDIDDPNFWELWARRLDLDPRQLLSSSGVVVDEPRIKRQARRLKQEDLHLGDFEGRLAALAKDRMLEEAASSTEPQSWSAPERAAFLGALFRFGIHRFDELAAQFPVRSKNDLIACARAVIKACLEAVEGDDASDARLREDNEKLLLAHLDFDRSALGHGSEMVDEATGKIDLAAAELVAEEPAEPTAPATREFSRADIPFSGASRRQILEFRSFLREAPAEIQKGLEAHAKAILLRLQLLDFVRQLTEGHATVAKKGAKTSNSGEMQYQLPVPHLVGAAPIKGWGKAEDEALVIGIYRHGFGRYRETREDPTLIFSTMPWREAGEQQQQQPQQGEEEAPPLWPSDKELEERLKKVVLAMEKKTQAAAKLAIQAMQASETGARRRAVTLEDGDEMYEEEYDPGERRRQPRGRSAKAAPPPLSLIPNARWSKRDRGEFQRVVMAYGLPLEKTPGRRDWARFKELGAFANALLRAGDRAFDEYCELFVKGCRAVADKRTARRGSKKTAAAVAAAMDEDGDEPGEDAEEEEEGIYKGDNGAADAGLQLPQISAERAKRALARIELFDKLRQQLLSLDDLGGHFERSRRTSGLPSWWETPTHDVALLRAAAKYGLGRWDLVVLDGELPFRAVYEAADPEAFQQEGRETAPEAAPTTRAGRRKNLQGKGTPSGGRVDLAKIGWPAEAILTRRVEALVEMALNEERRRMSDAGGDEARAGSKRRRAPKPRQRRGKASNAAEAEAEAKEEKGSSPEKRRSSPTKRPSPRKRGKQSSLLDFARKKGKAAEKKDREADGGADQVPTSDSAIEH